MNVSVSREMGTRPWHRSHRSTIREVTNSHSSPLEPVKAVTTSFDAGHGTYTPTRQHAGPDRTDDMPLLAVGTAFPPTMNNGVATLPGTADSPSPIDATPWIGGTGLGSTGLGKSGRVIERLMAENDRLRRELKAEIAKQEELQRAVQNQKPKLDLLSAENSRLANIKAMDDNIIQRRDRKIDELKSDLESERRRRVVCEQRAQDSERRREESEEATRIDLQTANEQARHATVHAEILQTSHQQLAKEYKQRIATTMNAISDLVDEKDEDRRKLARLGVVTHQLRHESETQRRLFSELSSTWSVYRREKAEQFDEYEASAEAIRQAAQANEDHNHRLQREMQDIMGRMRWLLALESARSGSVDDRRPDYTSDTTDRHLTGS